MCTPQGIIEKLGCTVVHETTKQATKAGKYVLQYKSNLKKLETEMKNLDDRMKIIEVEVKEAIDRGEVIEEDVSGWQTDANTMKSSFMRLRNQSTVEAKIHCFACSCPNIKWRYLLSKQAEKMIADVKELTQKSYIFNKISHHRPPPPELEYPSHNNYVNLDSRTTIFKEIVDALRRPNANVIGVTGPGGVGKTTLVVDAAKKMQDDGAFNQVLLATVSKDLNVREIQKKLADQLHLELYSPTDENITASQLQSKFSYYGEKYLIILDDIWDKLDLKAIGIPITDGRRGCKVVLTSRSEDLLVKTMKVDFLFPIAELSEAEAWVLFKKKVGNSSESLPHIDSLAREVCKYCKGLPVAINALGAALKGKLDYAWEVAINKLEGYMSTNIEGINQNVYASLRASYDMLWSSDAKSYFLVCCFFPENAVISIDDLARQCLARSLLSQYPSTLEEARNVVRTEVHSLKSASLLSNDGDENVIRVHDVIRDVGISIAREMAFLVNHGAVQWPQNPINGPPYLVISINSANINALPSVLTCPKLHTLMFHNRELLDLEVPDNFFNGMKQLKVLILHRMHMRQLPSSLTKLASLGMLCLDHCELPDIAKLIAKLRDLKNSLEVLSLRGSTVKALPEEIGELTSLLLLDLRDCENLKVIPQGVISNLTSLEELYLPDTFGEWEATEGTSIKNIALEELRRSLSTGQLTTLHIHIPNVMLLPMDGLMLNNLKRFKISVGSNFKSWENFQGMRALKYEGSSIRNEFTPLVHKAEVLYLSGTKGLKTGLLESGVENGFLDLKYLNVISCDYSEYLLGETESFVQSHGLHPFSKLTELFIKGCKLKYLFAPTIARGLVHLKQLDVRDCGNMEEIVRFEGHSDENELIFSKLKILYFESLPKLISFYAEKEKTPMPTTMESYSAKKEKTQTTIGSSSAHHQPLFNEKVILPVLVELEIKGLDSIEEIWDKQPPSVNPKTVSVQLRRLVVTGCKKLMNLVPSNILPQLRNLQTLEVKDCPKVEFVIFKNGKEEEEVDDRTLIILPQLRRLVISEMENLKSFYSSSTTSNGQSLFNHQVILPILEVLEVEYLRSIEEIWDKQSPSVNQETVSFGQLRNMTVKYCQKLMNLVPSNILPQLRNLRSLQVEACPKVEFIVFKNEEEEAADDRTLIIPQLSYLAIHYMWNLKSFYSSSTTFNAQSLFNHQVIFPVLEELSIDNVGKITEIWDKQSIAAFEAQRSFYQLMKISVWKCNKLMHVYPSKMHPVLKNIKELRVWECKTMEGIVGFEGELDEDGLRNEVCFSQLSVLRLMSLPELVSFYTKMGEAGTTQGNPTIHAQPLFHGKVAFPALEDLAIWSLPEIKEIWDKWPLPESEKEAKSFSKLRVINVWYCDQLVNVFPSYTLPWLQNLEELKIWNCKEMEVIISNKLKEREMTPSDLIVFPQLKAVTLQGLPKVKSIYAGVRLVFFDEDVFPVLEDIDLDEDLEMLRNWTRTTE